MIKFKNFSNRALKTAADEQEIIDGSIGQPTMDGDTFRFFKVKHNKRGVYPTNTRGYQDAEVQFYDEESKIFHLAPGKGCLSFKADKMRVRYALCTYTEHNINILVRTLRMSKDKERGYVIMDQDVLKEVERKHKIWWESLTARERADIEQTEAQNNQTAHDMPARWGSKTVDELGANPLMKQNEELKAKLEALEKKNLDLQTEKIVVAQEILAEKEVPKSDVPVEWIRMKPFELYKVLREKDVEYEKWLKKDDLISLLMSDDPKALLAKYRLERANNDDKGIDSVHESASNELDPTGSTV